MSFSPFIQDSVSLAVLTTDSARHNINQGTMFRYADSVTLGAAGTQDYLVITPNTTTLAHFSWFADGIAVTSFGMYEGADRTGTTLQTVYNANRNSAIANTTVVYKGQSGGTTDGTLIHFYSSGASQGNSVDNSLWSFDDKWILKSNTKYLFRITSGTASNLCNIGFIWYEHINGTV